MNNKKVSYAFKKNMSVGSMDASEDGEYLYKCFVDTGYLDLLTNTSSPKSIVLGRTGSGKTALLNIVSNKNDNVINLLPQELSLNYITDSNIIRFFESTGVKLDLFYQLLWRHVLTVELIKKKFKINNENNKQSFVETLTGVFKNDKGKKQAVEYLEEWGDKFWLETDTRVQEFTTKLEQELSASIDLKSIGVPLTAGAGEKLSTEKKEQVTFQAQKVVNRIQIQQLNKVIDLLADDIFDNEQQKYYIVIDKLDDEWVDDNLRYRLIRALIETIKIFRKIESVKIVVALRSDLLGRVFDKTRDAGFQEEKYEDYILNIKWKPSELKELLDKRINLLFRETYTKQGVSFKDIFVGKPNGEDSIDFILSRTLMRPRDAISFTNLCIDDAYGKTNISTEVMKNAEQTYSKKRFNALCYEWVADYPLLEDYCAIIPNGKGKFKHSDITDKNIVNFVMEIAVNDGEDPIKNMALKIAEDHSITKASLKNNVLAILYRVGIIGIKRTPHTATEWSHEDTPDISESNIKKSQGFEVHQMLWRYLGVFTDPRKIKK